MKSSNNHNENIIKKENIMAIMKTQLDTQPFKPTRRGSLYSSPELLSIVELDDYAPPTDSPSRSHSDGSPLLPRRRFSYGGDQSITQDDWSINYDGDGENEDAGHFSLDPYPENSLPAKPTRRESYALPNLEGFAVAAYEASNSVKDEKTSDDTIPSFRSIPMPQRARRYCSEPSSSFGITVTPPQAQQASASRSRRGTLRASKSLSDIRIYNILKRCDRMTKQQNCHKLISKVDSERRSSVNQQPTDGYMLVDFGSRPCCQRRKVSVPRRGSISSFASDLATIDESALSDSVLSDLRDGFFIESSGEFSPLSASHHRAVQCPPLNLVVANLA